MLLAGLGSTAAFAANAGTITLTAPAGETLANHSFSAYKIGDYSGYEDANANGKIDGTNVTNAAGAQAWCGGRRERHSRSRTRRAANPTIVRPHGSPCL